VRGPLLLISLIAAAAVLSACGQQGIDVASDSGQDVEDGAVIFAERCSGCHTMEAAGAQGTANRSQRTQGPNLDQRKETYEDALYAIQNGGFSGAIMPQNIVVGEDAEKVARFVEEYSGGDVDDPVRPGQP
jgi:mono/diheme cytochrome c family protein